MRFPSPRVIDARLKSKSIQQSIAFLLKHQNALSKYKDMEDFILRDEIFATKTNIEPKILQACEYHLINEKTILLLQFRGRNLFLGSLVLDEVLFQTFSKICQKNPII